MRTPAGAVVRGAHQVGRGERLVVTLADGRLDVTVAEAPSVTQTTTPATAAGASPADTARDDHTDHDHEGQRHAPQPEHPPSRHTEEYAVSPAPTPTPTPTTPGRDDPDRSDPATMPYEAARDELLDIVRRLESGSTDLEESLELWERGEALAARCQQVLDGALERLDATTRGPADTPGAAADG